MARTTSAAMRELMELSGASQAQVERWQKKGFVPRFPRSYTGGGGSRSVLTDEIVERARMLADYARQGASDRSPISLIATLTEPDVGLLREAVVESITALHRRLGMDIEAASPEQAANLRLAAADQKARRQGRMWTLRDFAEGPVKEGSALPLAELLALLNRDSDDEIDPGDLDEAVDVVMRMLRVSGPDTGPGIPLMSLLEEPVEGAVTDARMVFPPGAAEQARAEIRRLLLAAPTFNAECELVRAAPADKLIRACRLVPQARRVQIIAVSSARIAYLRHTGELTAEMFSGWHDLGMSYADMQRMEAHPMWKRWGKMLAGGGVKDSADGHRIAVCLEDPALLDQLEAYIAFLASLIPARALHRLAFHQFQPGEARMALE
ncbi:hypothetical protein [Streptomyces virginiae]|uniref:hypothetical protein n=1 Tax=Streptomyces virginiae TaxID=1961 RepID=UPI002F90E549